MYRSKALSTVLTNSFKSLINNSAITKRNLYAPTVLGMDGFLHARERIKMQITNADNFRSKMAEFVADENSKNLVFTEDLRNMLHISEKSDVELLSKMITKFCSQSKETRFGNFVFGPPIMRLMYHLEDPDTALKLFKDETMNQNGFFDQLISYQILLDLLYIKGRYQEVLDAYDLIKERQVQGGIFPKHVIVLALASCYKLNTPASYEYASGLYRTASSRGNLFMRRGLTFFATLALRQSAPHVALEVLTTIDRQSYLTVRTIKALAFADLKRYDDVIQILRAVLETDNPMVHKHTFPSDAIEHLKKAFEGNTNETLRLDFKKVVGFIEKHGHITENTLDDILGADIQQTMQYPGGANDVRDNRFQRDNRRGGFDRDNYNRNSYDQRNNRSFQRRELDYPSERARRPGLHELN